MWFVSVSVLFLDRNIGDRLDAADYTRIGGERFRGLVSGGGGTLSARTMDEEAKVVWGRWAALRCGGGYGGVAC